jgi:hypothetical protein
MKNTNAAVDDEDKKNRLVNDLPNIPFCQEF